MQRRVCALVMGMHRSGTSCLAGALSLLGFTPPTQMIGANRSNPKGHWEATPVARLNDRILEFSGSHWRDWEPLSRSWHNTPYFDRFVDEGAAILKEMFGDSPMIVLKDPRLSRLHDVWREILRREGFSITIFLPFRHPAEVAASLGLRNQIDPSQAQFLWLRYMLDAERGTRGASRFVFRYADFVGDWRGTLDRATQCTDTIFPRLNTSSATTVDAFVDVALYRNRVDPTESPAPLHPLLAEAYAIFSAWADGEENTEDHARLDEIEQAFTALSRRIHPLFETFDSIQAQLDTLSTSVSRQKNRLDETLAHLTTVEGTGRPAANDFRGVIDAQAHDVGAMLTILVTLSQQLFGHEQGLRADFTSLIADIDGDSEKARSAAAMEIALLREETEDLRNCTARLHAEAEANAEGVRVAKNASLKSETEAAIAAERAANKVTDLESRLSVVTSELEQKRAETDHIYAERDELLSRINALESQIEAAAEREREHLANLDQATTEILEGLDGVVAVSYLLRNEEQNSAKLANELKAASMAAIDSAKTVKTMGEQAEQLRTKLTVELQSRKDTEQQLRVQEDKVQALQSQLASLRQNLEIKVQERREIRAKKEQVDRKLIKLRTEHAELQYTSSELQQTLTESHAKAASLSDELARKSADKSEADRKLRAARERHDVLEAQIFDAEQKRKQADRLGEADRSNALFTSFIVERMTSEKLTFPTRRSASFTWLPGTPFWKWKRFCRKLVAQGAFDPAAYLALNPDVAATGIDPLVHFLTNGLAERRRFAPTKDA